MGMQVGQEYARRVEERELAAMERSLKEVDTPAPEAVVVEKGKGKKESRKTK
jgi:hypothetical protein